MPLFHRIHLGPYEILASIDAGGMGEVDRAHDSRLNRFATKISDAQFAERFTREARAIAVLDHTNCVSIERGALENEFFS
jgi:eukaryotic-like serine/threonine-protein kinase